MSYIEGSGMKSNVNEVDLLEPSSFVVFFENLVDSQIIKMP
jgi:hypothetical protein